MRQRLKLVSIALVAIAGLTIAGFSGPVAARDCYWDGTAPICAGKCKSGYEQVQSRSGGCLTGKKVRCCEKMGHTASDGPGQSYKPKSKDCGAAAELWCKKVCTGTNTFCRPASMSYGACVSKLGC